jgi:predicted solute-binding protein
MKKYNLKWYQWMIIPIVFLFWLSIEERKPWHLVLKGMEPHKHKFTKPTDAKGIYQCEHEGCTLCDDLSI